jgi:hypothetical protein
MAKVRYNKDNSRVILKLSPEEAQTLSDILSYVGGMFDTRRAYSDEVLYALVDAGYDFRTPVLDIQGDSFIKFVSR